MISDDEHQMPIDHSGSGWRDRCAAWMASSAEPIARKRRERSSDPLILCGHGISLRVEGGTLAIKNGFTHHPQTQETFRFFRGDLNRPSRIIVLDGSGALTFDVLDWLAEQDTPMIRVSWTGEVTTVAGGSGYSADRTKVEWQRRTRGDERERVRFSAELIREKLRNSADTLETTLPVSSACARVIDQMRHEHAGLTNDIPASVDELRGVEARAAAAYFSAWQNIPLSWKASARKPIPAEWHRMGPRSSMRAGKKAKNRNATHPVNAMLNYSYAVAIGGAKIKALADGYDPTIGIMHHGYRDNAAFALDLVEPMRPLVDRAVLGMVLADELHPADFVLTGEGECRLNPQLAKRVAQIAERVVGTRECQ